MNHAVEYTKVYSEIHQKLKCKISTRKLESIDQYINLVRGVNTVYNYVQKIVINQMCLRVSTSNVSRFRASFKILCLFAAYRKGEIPKYLKDMKIKEIERNRLLSLVDVNCPPGHTLLSESDRLESLQITQKSKILYLANIAD